MQDNAISLVRISELFGSRFFVPDYQRGYRWTKTQVQDLLSDIFDFAQHKEKGEIYCLQPLVVKRFEVSDESNIHNLEVGSWYEVIDGQQRLTTIKILFSYFINKGRIDVDWLKNNEIIIKYGTRTATGLYLSNLAVGGIENNFFENSRDIDHIKSAYQTIEDWFKKFSSRADSVLTKILDTMSEPFPDDDLENEPERLVKFILFEVDPETNSIDAFERINIGKINLTNAELIKALFLQKSNFSNENENHLRRQLEIAEAWDQIECSLHDDNFWCFLNKNTNEETSRIGFIFDFIYCVETGNYPQQNDEYETFRFFSEKLSKSRSTDGDFGKVTSMWTDIRKYYDTFREWYSDIEMYHYIGFLVFQDKSDLKTIYDLYVGTHKSEFKEQLKILIRKNLNVSYKLSDPDENGKRNYQIGISYDSASSKKSLREFFLLLNIQYLIKTDHNGYFRFSFENFKKENWDIEHIDSYTENQITRESDQKKWIDVALEALTLEERAEYNEAIKNACNLGFSEHRELIIRISGEFEESATAENKNSVGNLTLLDSETNRSYGNALFPTKRKEIINRDSNGQFVLPCTKAVFLKYFTKDCASLKRWNKDDIVEYTNYIGQILSTFMKKDGD